MSGLLEPLKRSAHPSKLKAVLREELVQFLSTFKWGAMRQKYEIYATGIQSMALIKVEEEPLLTPKPAFLLKIPASKISEEATRLALSMISSCLSY